MALRTLLLEAVGDEHQVPGFVVSGQVPENAVQGLMLGAAERLRRRQNLADDRGYRTVQQNRTEDSAFGCDVLQMG